MGDLPNFSYRSLERLCRAQAELSTTPQTRKELERMAREYGVLADCQDDKRRDQDETMDR
jgi:hypothetical protein